MYPAYKHFCSSIVDASQRAAASSELVGSKPYKRCLSMSCLLRTDYIAGNRLTLWRHWTYLRRIWRLGKSLPIYFKLEAVKNAILFRNCPGLGFSPRALPINLETSTQKTLQLWNTWSAPTTDLSCLLFRCVGKSERLQERKLNCRG